MSKLKSITIGKSVTSINSDAFEGCIGLNSVTWNAKNCDGYNFGSQVEKFVFGDSVQVIPSSICSGMSKLTSITIPNSVTNIGDGAFSYCSGLTSITIPNSVTEFGDGIILKNYALDTIISPAGVFNSNEEEYLSVNPNAVSYIEIVGGELTNDGFAMIQRQYKTLKTLKWDAIENTTLADEALKGCYNLDSLTLPSQLVSVAYSAVADCKSLKAITIPATVQTLEASAFENCRSLNKVEFADNSQLQSIGNWCFYNCHELKSITIPEGVTEIGLAAFFNCTYLEEITVPASMNRIEDNGFALCSKLKKMTVNASIPPTIDAKTFEDVDRSIPVYVPAGSKTTYENEPYWKEFFNIIEHKTPTGFDDLNSTSNSSVKKVLLNGELYILRDGKTYTIQGAEVKAPL